MSKQCGPTHHHACECREAYFKRIEEWALEAREVLEKIRARTGAMNIKSPTVWADKVLAKFPGEKDE